MSEIPLMPLENVELWDSFYDANGTLWYALLNRQRNYAAEVWKRDGNGNNSFVWRSSQLHKCSGISICPIGRALSITYSHSATPDSSTPFRPYQLIIPDVLPQTNPQSPPANITINNYEDRVARATAHDALAKSNRAINWLTLLSVREGQAMTSFLDDWIWSNPPKLVDWLYAQLKGYGLL